MNIRVRFIALVVTGVLIGTLVPALTVQAQGVFAHGAVVALQGTPHLWIAGPQGVLHWAGDTRALAGKHVLWSNRIEVTLAQLQGLNRGDPWLSAGLLKDGDPIYLVKWETEWSGPRLFHIQSIGDVELFGINGSNYGNFVLDRATWEQRFGVSAAGLQRSTLPAATAPPAPAATPLPTVVSEPGSSQVIRFSGSSWGLASSGRSDASETTITERGLRLRVFEPGWQSWKYLSRTTSHFVFQATGTQTEGDGGGILLIIGHERETGYLEFYIDLTSRRAYLQRRDRAVDAWHTLTSRSNLTNIPQRGRPFTLEVRVWGQRIRGSLNGSVILEVLDPLYIPGFIGLGAAAHRSSGPVTVEWQSAEVHYLTLDKPPPVPPTVRSDWMVHNGATGRLLRALELLWVHNVEDWRSKFGRPLADRRTEIVWGSLPEKVGGRYESSPNRIIISESYQSEPLSVLAAVLAHEVYHAVSGRVNLRMRQTAWKKRWPPLPGKPACGGHSGRRWGGTETMIASLLASVCRRRSIKPGATVSYVTPCSPPRATSSNAWVVCSPPTNRPPALTPARHSRERGNPGSPFTRELPACAEMTVPPPHSPSLHGGEGAVRRVASALRPVGPLLLVLLRCVGWLR